ncbi:MAG: glycosyltransferase [Candidatus Latescibacteria bacterium]|jgi:L-malate glycosyltransferase|nr:glycosyltransferase [Candidatus Latescibacterota bacterium]
MSELKIAHIDTALSWRGGERQVLELIKELNARNQKNVLFCKQNSIIFKRAQDAGIHVIHLPLRGEWDVVSALKLRTYIKREKIKIVHAHTSHAHSVALMALWHLDSCKLVVSRRVDFHINNYFSRRFKYGLSVDKFIAVSDAVKRILVEDGIDPKRVETVRSGFVQEKLLTNGECRDLRAELGISEKTIVISTVAALAPHKAHYVLIKTANQVVKKHPNVKFLFAGEGEMKSVIKKNISNLGLEKSIILLGFIEDIGAVYRASDIFALSSEEEGLCSSILDAMYFSLPIVATSAGGIPELVKDEVNGLIVPVGDYMLFNEKLNYLIEYPERRKKMGSRSLEFLEKNKFEQTVEKTLQIYKSLFE